VKDYRLRLLTDAGFCFAAELLHASYTRALVGGLVAPAVALSFALPFLTFCGAVWFIEERNWKRRLGYVAAGSLGYALGTCVVMLLWP
jgi:hypothetical protein